MGIENLIANGVTPLVPENYTAAAGRAMTLRQMMQQNIMGKLAQQEGELKLKQAQRAESFDQNTRDWMQSQMGGGQPAQAAQLGDIDHAPAGAQPQPGGAAAQTQGQALQPGVRGVPPGMDIQALIQHKMSIGDVAGAQALQQLALKNDETRSIAAKNFGQAGDSAVKVAKAHTEALGQATGSLMNLPPDQQAAMYPQVRAQLIQDGHIKPQDAPEQFPGQSWLQFTHDKAMTADQQINAHIAQQDEARKTALAPSQLAESQAKAASEKVKADQMQLLGQTKTENITQQGQAAQRAESARHNKVDEGYAGQRVGIAGAELGLNQKRFNATIGSGLDANGQPLSSDALKAAAAGDPLAKQIAAYQIPPPKSITDRTGLGAAMMRKVLAIDPTYDGTQFQARNKTQQDFSPAGKSGQAITGADTALAHLDTISKAGAALKNGNLPILNGLANKLGVQLGQSPQQTYDTIVGMVAPEISKAVIGASGGEGERQAMAHNFSSAANDQQREGAIGAAAQLLGARVHKQSQAYESQMKKPLDRQLSPESQSVLDRYSGGDTHALPKAGDTFHGGKVLKVEKVQ